MKTAEEILVAKAKNSADFVQDPENPNRVLYMDHGQLRSGHKGVMEKLYLQHEAGTVEDPEQAPLDHNMEVLNSVLQLLNKTSVFTNKDQYGSALGEVAYNMTWKAAMRWLGIETEYFTENYRRGYDSEATFHKDKDTEDTAPIALEQRSETTRMELAYWSNLTARVGNPVQASEVLGFFIGNGGSAYEPASEDDLIRATMEITGKSFDEVATARAKALEGRTSAAAKDVVKSNMQWLHEEMSRIMRSKSQGLRYDMAPRANVDTKTSFAGYEQGSQGVFSALIQLQDACRKRAAAAERKANKDKAQAVLIERLNTQKTWLRLAKEVDGNIATLLASSNITNESYNPITGILEASMH